MPTVQSVQRDATTDPRWARVAARDAGADGAFVYAVATTGVYCRPSCMARLAKPRNVRFYATPAEARAAGYRACKRCKPDGASPRAAQAEIVAAACRAIATAETPPRLTDLARAAGLSAFHFHRLFKAQTGVTPKAYAAAHRTARVRAELTRGGSVTDALYGAGYNSSGRFYAEADAALGMTPRAFRAGGEAERIRFAVGACSLGTVLVAGTDKGLCAILLGDDPKALARDLAARFPRATLIDDNHFADTIAAVIAFVDTPALGLDLPLDIRGTAFQRRVWEALRKVPAGKTVTYTEIARAIDAPNAVRAVAGACAANPLAVAIPCHRVLRKGGDISGYRWGVERKRALLRTEKNS